MFLGGFLGRFLDRFLAMSGGRGGRHMDNFLCRNGRRTRGLNDESREETRSRNRGDFLAIFGLRHGHFMAGFLVIRSPIGWRVRGGEMRRGESKKRFI
jgi:hypothetical protein